jgi:hypothetical protein
MTPPPAARRGRRPRGLRGVTAQVGYLKYFILDLRTDPVAVFSNATIGYIPTPRLGATTAAGVRAVGVCAAGGGHGEGPGGAVRAVARARDYAGGRAHEQGTKCFT